MLRNTSACFDSARTPSQRYPQVWRNGRPRNESRVVWEDARGPIPFGLLVCHRCDNPRCVRIEHLFLGTDADNHRDSARKGRRSNQYLAKRKTV